MQNQTIKVLHKDFLPTKFKNYLTESEIKQLVQNQKFHKNIKIINQLDYSQNSIIEKELSSQNQLTGLNFTYLQDTLNSEQPLLELMKSLCSLKQLNYLFIKIDKQKDLGDLQQFIIQLGRTLEQLDCLELLSLEIEPAYLINRQCAIQIKNSFKKLMQLKYLEFNFLFTQREEDDLIIKEVYSDLYLPNITHLDLTIRQTFLYSYYNEPLEHISSSLLKLLSLESLNLNIECTKKFTSKNIDSFRNSIIRLKNLRILGFQIKFSQIEIRSTIDLLNALFTLEKIESIDLAGQFREDIDDTFIIGSSIQEGAQLRKLKLDLESIYSSEGDVSISLSENIKFLQQLTTLDIKLITFIMKDDNIEQIKNLFVLKEFSFEIFNTENKIDTLLIKLGENLKQLKQLTLLTLYLNIESDAFYTCIKTFAQNISQMKQLQELVITFDTNFQSCQRQIEFINYFSQLEILKTLDICYNNYEFDEIQTEQQNESIPLILQQNLETLQLTLHFNINIDKIYNIAQNFYSLSNLKYLMLDIQNISYELQLSKEEGQILFDCLSCLKNLNQLILVINFQDNTEYSKITKMLTSCLVQLKQLNSFELVSNLMELYGRNVSNYIKRKQLSLVSVK